MDINVIRGLGTIFALFAFLCIVAWAYNARSKDRFEDDGMIPFLEDDDDTVESANKNAEQKNANDDKGSE
ncbi:MAG: CcoQ/FixQ family Cbb3-type cytochrome c oxidase assembly chaperone [Oleispira antarctica]|uniref:Cbb3-type cytochrome oxidase component n=1 Tax=Oleispira antarctica RB-8 TaxID=698738 RepID=R4YTH9_OLEAN|nr:CcoQ/FixQ family Cbb3-type cytochrome c oxidase assembly chaperone [Oleispira antarctica]MBQ0793845.1 CcoQ/FixQ family Cbb3-type cytochrome c oxidase assembly chaperone [Oleispira antarctica]CCK75824.1 Cbb3-type cytochrome oxidase component [Oleispira antarctica RB-8]|tara:strand:- start:3704 stop:3913 length:210 start_codon:yes stop_codon:yes gene_type:complete